jgi:hypothetical protein
MNNPFSTLFSQIADRRRARQFEKFREFMETYQTSQAWTLLKCPMCELPAPAPDARFCVRCGASLYASSSLLHPLFQQEQHTDPVLYTPGERFLSYVQERHQDTGPHTLYHRSVHLKEKATHP